MSIWQAETKHSTLCLGCEASKTTLISIKNRTS